MGFEALWPGLAGASLRLFDLGFGVLLFLHLQGDK